MDNNIDDFFSFVSSAANTKEAVSSNINKSTNETISNKITDISNSNKATFDDNFFDFLKDTSEKETTNNMTTKTSNVFDNNFDFLCEEIKEVKDIKNVKDIGDSKILDKVANNLNLKDEISNKKKEISEVIKNNNMVKDIKKLNNEIENKIISEKDKIPSNLSNVVISSIPILSVVSNKVDEGLKKLNLSSEEKMKAAVKSRLIKLTNEYVFTLNYSDNIISFFRKFNSVILAKVEYSLDFNKKYQTFFKSIAQCYLKFAKDIEITNDLILTSNNQGMILNTCINSYLEKVQGHIAKNFEKFSNIISQNSSAFTVKESKVKDFYIKLSNISKEIDNSITNIIKHRNSIFKDYEGHKKILDEIKATKDEKLLDKLLSKNDIFTIEYKHSINFRIMNCMTKDFLILYKEKLIEMQLLLLDYVTLLKESIDSYILQNKKIFNDENNENETKNLGKENKKVNDKIDKADNIDKDDKVDKADKVDRENNNNVKEKISIVDNDKNNSKILKDSDKIFKNKDKKDENKNNEDTKTKSQPVNNLNNEKLSFKEIQKHFDSLNKNSVDDIFSTKQILSYEKIDVDKEYLKNLNEILTDYQRNLLVSNHQNMGNIEIKEFNKFKLENHIHLKDFLDFMILVNPEIRENLSEYIKHDFVVKRENGLIFDKWASCRIIITYQSNLLIYDLNKFNENSADLLIPKLIEKIPHNEMKFSTKDNKKSPFNFYLSTNKKGMIFDKKISYCFDAETEETLNKIKEVFS